MKTDIKVTPTPEQIEGYCQKLIAKLKQDPEYELMQEYGRLLMKHIDSFTPEERKRYDELTIILNHKR